VDYFLHGCKTVRSVCVDDVDILEVEALEGCPEAFDDVLAAQAVVVDKDLAVGTTPIDCQSCQTQ
jgi:hypothetical protein